MTLAAAALLALLGVFLWFKGICDFNFGTMVGGLVIAFVGFGGALFELMRLL